MIELTLLLIISFLTGISTKLVDLIEDDGLRLFKFDKFVFAVIYGLLMGYVISNYNLIASLWIGTVFALILARKIDTKAHIAGIISALVFVVILGLGRVNILFLVIFFTAAFLDEMLSDFAEGKPLLKNQLLKKPNKIKINKNIRKILELRPFLEISALIISFIIWNFSLFGAILFFDLGYILSSRVGLKLKK
ncbi:hypothetical protein ISS05_00140 [Candidatus Woesearchaeota archaeon]|nr:hypothetical protein [Candidatus Woesearchaeota archaeon]